MNKRTYGFTIVELLIVIVVIAILAAITIVAYNGIQQRANNTAIVSAASQIAKAVQAYIAQEGAYPALGAAGNVCVTTSSGCVRDTGGVDSANTAFDTNMAKVAVLPRSVPNVGAAGNGIVYNYTAGRTHNGDTQPVMIFYFLNGTSQSCGMSGVMSHWSASTTPSNAYTANTSIGKTLCYVTIPGPTT